MNKSKTRKLRLPLLIFSLFFLAILCGCGDGPGESNNSSGGTTPTPTGSGTLTMALTKVSDGTSTSSVASGSPTRLTVTARDKSGTPIAAKVVTLTQTSAGMVTFSPSDAALTDSGGVASFIIYAGTTPGATEIKASITDTAGNVISGSAGIAVATSNLRLSSLTITPATISAGGTASISVTVLDGSGNPYTQSVPIAFTSAGVQSGKATITATVYTDKNGIASATYRDINYGNVDTITATLTGTTITSSGTLTVTAASVGSIIFVSATPIDIALPGSGRTDQSVILFQVLDTNGKPKKATVGFTLDTYVGGITRSPVSADSDPTTGYVQTIIQAGSIPTPVRVQAVVDVAGTTLTSTSDRLSISTGIPAQHAFSMSASILNLEGLTHDGEKTAIRVMLADRFNNPVPNGTVVNFRTSGGVVEANCRTGEKNADPLTCQGGVVPSKGECCVYLTSAEPRPYIGQPGAQPFFSGRVVVLAYALGEESFIDANSNGRFDLGESFTDMPEPFLDVNESYAKDPLEPYINTNEDGTYTAADGKFNGILRDDSIEGPTQIHVRKSIVVTFSGSTAVITPTTATMASCLRDFNFTLTDENNNPMPAGTTITTSGNHVTFMAIGSTTPSAATISIDYGTPVRNTSTYGGTAFGLTVEANNCSAPPAGSFNIVVTTPRGLPTVIPISIN